MRNHHVSTLLHTVRLRYTSSNSNSGTTFFSTISCLFLLIRLISLLHQTCKKSYQTFHLFTYSYLLYLKSPCRHSPCPLLFHDPLLPTAPLHYTYSNSNSGTTFSHFPSKILNKYTSSKKFLEMPTWPSKNHTTA